MADPTTLKSIAELWDRFSKLLNYIETEKVLESWGKLGSDGLSHDGRNHSNDEGEFEALRAELLERCRCQGISIYEAALGGSWVQETSLGGTKRTNALAAREKAAALNFMAWELEQQAKERSVGNGL